jgi:dipeptidyl-peptidase-4
MAASFRSFFLPVIALSSLVFAIPGTVLAQDFSRYAVRTIPFANAGVTGYPPRDGVWSPDGTRLTFVANDGQIGEPGDIVQIDAVTGKGSVLASAQAMSKLASDAINEKDADHRARYNMASFLWADDGKHLLLDSGGKLWLWDIAAATGTLVVDTGAGSGDDPKFSPDAKSVSYIRNHNLYVHPVAGGAETTLTADPVPTLLNGEVDWVYLEELDVRSNYFWAPDSSAVAYLQMDEAKDGAKVPVYPITDFIPLHPTIDQQRYPQPGDPNPAVRVGVVSASGGPTKWIQLPFSLGNDMIPRFGWVDAKTLWIEVLRRDQKSRSLFFADAQTGQSREVYTDVDAKYLNFDYDVTILPGGRFVTSSWRDGYTHLYLYRYDAKQPLAGAATLVRLLTPGTGDVSQVLRFDATSDVLWYLSNQGSPLDSALWQVKLDGSAPLRVTTTPGTHDAVVSPDHKHYVDIVSTRETPPEGKVCPIAVGGECVPFWRSNVVPAATGVTSSFVEFTAADGKTKLYGTLVMPSDAKQPASVPLIMNPYGGPTPTPGVHNGWGSPFFDELMAQHGFAILSVDNRGGGGRGRDFQQAAYHNFGPVQFSDQMAALDQALARYPQLDAKRLGWWGWSWGGTFTLHAMTHSDRFKAGVAVAPVTDFRNYDSIYTERYMGQPYEDADGYQAASVTAVAANLKGRVLIAAGTGDDNVHLANTIQFLEPLINAGIPYDLQLFPRKTHSIAGFESRNELFERILAHFETYLK